MKKIHLLSGFLMLVVTTTLFVACHKEQNGIAPEKKSTNRTTDNETVNGVAVNGDGIYGFITSSDAEKMRSAYLKANPNGTQYVSFQMKDLEGFLNVLKSKYKSDVVYVNFGVYDSQTGPGKEGKTTVFFSGNDKTTQTGGAVTNAADPTYLNHGGIYP